MKKQGCFSSYAESHLSSKVTPLCLMDNNPFSFGLKHPYIEALVFSSKADLSNRHLTVFSISIYLCPVFSPCISTLNKCLGHFHPTCWKDLTTCESVLAQLGPACTDKIRSVSGMQSLLSDQSQRSRYNPWCSSQLVWGHTSGPFTLMPPSLPLYSFFISRLTGMLCSFSCIISSFFLTPSLS